MTLDRKRLERVVCRSESITMRPMPDDLSEPHACPPAPSRMAGSGDAIAATPYIDRANALQKLDRHEEALESYDQAIALDPGSADAFNDRGTVLQCLQRYDEALASHDRAATLRPDDASAYYNQGTALLNLGRHEEALARYDRAISLDPRYADAHMNRGLALQRLHRYEESLSNYDKAIALNPGWADAYNDRGAALQKLQRHEEALASYDKAAMLKPGCADACFNQGNALLALQRHAEALAHYDRAISLEPHHVDAHFNRGNALLNLHRNSEALASYERAAALRPDYADAFYNQGVALMSLERYAEALSRFDRAIALKPHHSDAYTNRGNALRNLQRYEEARASYDQSITLQSGNARACFCKAQLELGLGNFKSGWPLYESRWELDDVRPHRRSFSQAPWLGSEPIEGKTILLHSEQGLGDTIQFSRYVPLLAERGAAIAFEAPRSVARLLAGLTGSATIIASGDSLPAFDLHCPLLSVPGLVGTTVETIPARMPYLAAEPKLVAQWRERLPPGGIRIGIVWQGNPSGSIDRGRSAPLAGFAPLARLPGVRLISLQKHHGLDQLDRLPAGMAVETLGPDFDSGTDAFVDAAAVMMSLDLVISTDTAIVHLAGALNRPVWVALKAAPHWTWMTDRDDSPWYPSARLFRQTSDGDWRDVFERMAAKLISLRQR
ncbi:MAG: tetratricopeptide repeat-containing glycosyltransferase family protein [Reyranella sp.]|nr:tetratricopeptide repeat-containing glycosyltransferase family protein [Reyranella sp.]